MPAKVNIIARGVSFFVSALHHIAVSNCGQSIITRNVSEMKTRSRSINSTSIFEHYFDVLLTLHLSIFILVIN